jgi:hypothetical protein
VSNSLPSVGKPVVRLAEVTPDGRVPPLDPVSLYARDLKRWGKRAANANALYLLKIMTGVEEPPETTLEEAKEEAKEDPSKWAGVLIVWQGEESSN